MPQNTHDAIAQRRASVSTLYLKGFSQGQIAEQLEVTQQLVSQDLAQIRIDWQTSTLYNFHDQKVRELAKIDNLESEAWTNYAKSSQPITKKTKKRKGVILAGTQMAGDVERTKVVEEQLPDVRYMMIIMKCIEMRCKILGLDGPLMPQTPGTPTLDAEGQTIEIDTLPQNRWNVVDMSGGYAIPAPDDDYDPKTP